MNLWECEHISCSRVAYGDGGAIGLRAIGWYYAPGPMILCPAHHPDGVEVATKQAELYQAAMAMVEALGYAAVQGAS